MSEKIKDVEKMIAKVMKHKDCARTAAIDYMLIVATGRLLALKRYGDTLPEGKSSKGVFALNGRKKPAEKTPKLVIPDAAEKPAKVAKPKRARKPKPKQAELELAGAAE